jgi:hypothetical protein
VACVTPVRRVAGREVITIDGLPDEVRRRWVDALVATGGSQCGFCTPGIVMRLAANDAVGAGGAPPTRDRTDTALLAHLCRCTGWQTIEEAVDRLLSPATATTPPTPPRDLAAAAVRAGLEGGVPQRVGPEVVLGRAGFADDTAPADALVAVPWGPDRADGGDGGVDGGDGAAGAAGAAGSDGYVVAGSLAEARRAAGKVQGRRTSLPLGHPVAIPPGEWAVTLATTWVEPAYVEPDASWCAPGGEPASPVGNGGAFGGKTHSPVGADARRLADAHGRPVRVVWSREDVVRRGPKRPPVAGGADPDGRGVLRVAVDPDGVETAVWDDVCARVAAVAPHLTLEAVPVAGPPRSFDLRAAVWAEAAVLVAAARLAAGNGAGEGVPRYDVPVEVVAPGGGRAVARCLADGAIDLEVDGGPVLDQVVLRSYAIGATHQALGWVRSEGIAVDDGGEVRDLTIRSFGVLAARAMPTVTVRVVEGDGRDPVNGSDAAFAAVAAARWLADGLPSHWPTARGGPPQ